MATLATLTTVGILFIYHKKGEPEAGSRLSSISRRAGKLCRVLEKSGTRRSDTDERPDEAKGSPEGSEGPKGQSGNEPLTWINIAEIWDRFCFYVFIVLTILLNVVFILILAIGGILSSEA